MQRNHIAWGRSAFEKGVSLGRIENYLLGKGLNKSAALKALNDITSFEHKIHYESEKVSRIIILFIAIMMLILAVMIFLNSAGVI